MRMVAFGAALAVQLWSLAPVAASVIYCIGEDGHSGFELVKPGARGCASCCHDPAHDPAQDSRGLAGAPVSECIDIALSPQSGLTGKLGEMAGPERPAIALTMVAPAATALGRVAFRPDRDLEPPRGSAARMRRHTVLLI